MSLPGHRHTRSKKRRRASHFALVKANLSKDAKTGALHLSHRAAPGTMEYNGKPIHIKPGKRKVEKAAKKLTRTREKTAQTS
ncbi:50S ribosomal protein L32 [Patescibacteria group bacterium]|uniref:Large ribosomal subunit protein bL32 n=1 Tax=candidate division WWE3 bacterium TaxID=2053526 RepID=A0A928TTL4_UNCKA|nr:50S ribosomal protein L32 [candidate division WWE3 bacterium]MCL4732684.1 50S ribosomal protein L32 [Patescibacteria group bacterium]